MSTEGRFKVLVCLSCYLKAIFQLYRCIIVQSSEDKAQNTIFTVKNIVDLQKLNMNNKQFKNRIVESI